MADGLEAAGDLAGPKIKEAVDNWAENVRRDALQNLNRPRWLLSSSIVDKVKEYDKSGKVWAMAGFRFTSNDPRTPGKYGQFHEAGWLPNGKKQKSPERFLKQAKQANEAQLRRDLNDALADWLDLVNEEIQKQRTRAKG